MSEDFEMPKAPWPLRPFDWYFSWIADRSLAKAHSSVENQKLWRQVQRMAIVRYFVVLAVGIALAVLSPMPGWVMPLWFLLIYIATFGAATYMVQGKTYLSGWMGGRTAMVHSMVEAQQRGMGMIEWLQAESERDHNLFMTAHGVTPAQALGKEKNE